MALTCTREDCSRRDEDATSPHNHAFHAPSGLETCLSCGSFLAERDNLAFLLTTVGREDGVEPPWKGSWTRDGDGWVIRLWMPDNDHREDEPAPGHRVRITTRAGKVQVLRLGERLDETRKAITFAGPPRRTR